MASVIMIKKGVNLMWYNHINPQNNNGVNYGI